jgi:hypothetical protein
MDRCWDELHRAGKAIDAGHPLYRVVRDVATDFELPASPEAEAVRVFLDALCGTLPASPEAEAGRVFLDALCGTLADEEMLEAETALDAAAE